RISLESDGLTTFLSNHLTSIFGGIEPTIDNYDFRAFTGIQNCGRAAIPDRLAGCLSSAHDDSDFSFQSVSHKIPPTRPNVRCILWCVFRCRTCPSRFTQHGFHPTPYISRFTYHVFSNVAVSPGSSC